MIQVEKIQEQNIRKFKYSRDCDVFSSFLALQVCEVSLSTSFISFLDYELFLIYKFFFQIRIMATAGYTRPATYVSFLHWIAVI